jgi:hypothetical protein
MQMKKIKNLLAYIKIWLDLYWVELMCGAITAMLATLIVVAIVTGGIANGN